MSNVKRRVYLPFIFIILLFLLFSFIPKVYAESKMPFYGLHPKSITLRAKFYTYYGNSSDERKDNIYLAVKSLDNTFVDIGAEFSFNDTVGERTESRGYKTAKIIKNGKFTDGLGGGVCQVSTTLYNALILSGLKITECHPHSLPVSYISPSFDAMVNSGSADLRFINNTHNPVIIYAKADGETLTVSVYGEPMREKYIRKSIIKEEIPAPKEELILDYNGEYPELSVGERKVLSYSKAGYISEGILVKEINGKVVSEKRIRRDKYNAYKGTIIEGQNKIIAKSPV